MGTLSVGNLNFILFIKKKYEGSNQRFQSLVGWRHIAVFITLYFVEYLFIFLNERKLRKNGLIFACCLIRKKTSATAESSITREKSESVVEIVPVSFAWHTSCVLRGWVGAWGGGGGVSLIKLFYSVDEWDLFSWFITFNQHTGAQLFHISRTLARVSTTDAPRGFKSPKCFFGGGAVESRGPLKV